MSALLNRRFVALVVTQFLNGMALAPLFSLFVVYADKELHRPPLFAGGLRSIFFLLGGLCAIPGGALCDSIGRKRTYLLGLSGSITGTLLFMTHNEIGLVALCIYCGVAFGLSSTAGQTYMMESVPRTAVGMATAFFFVGSNVGGGLGNFIAAPLVEQLGFYRMGAIMTAATTTILVAASLALPAASSFATSAQHSNVAQSLAGYGDIIRRRPVQLLIAMRYLPTTYWGAHTLLLPYFIYQAMGGKDAPGSASAAAIYGGLMSIIPPFFQLLTGRVCDLGGRRLPTLVSIALTTAGALLLALFSNSLTALYVFGIGVACSAWALSTTMPGFVNDLASPTEKGRVLGVTHLAWSLGMLTGSIGGGWAIEFNPAAPFFIGVGLHVATLLCALMLFAMAPQAGGGRLASAVAEES